MERRLAAILAADVVGYPPAPPSTLPRQAILTTVSSQTGVHLGNVGIDNL
jgi:hypothetical protein